MHTRKHCFGHTEQYGDCLFGLCIGIAFMSTSRKPIPMTYRYAVFSRYKLYDRRYFCVRPVVCSPSICRRNQTAVLLVLSGTESQANLKIRSTGRDWCRKIKMESSYMSLFPGNKFLSLTNLFSRAPSQLPRINSRNGVFREKPITTRTYGRKWL